MLSNTIDRLLVYLKNVPRKYLKKMQAFVLIMDKDSCNSNSTMWFVAIERSISLFRIKRIIELNKEKALQPILGL